MNDLYINSHIDITEEWTPSSGNQRSGRFVKFIVNWNMTQSHWKHVKCALELWRGKIPVMLFIPYSY